MSCSSVSCQKMHPVPGQTFACPVLDCGKHLPFPTPCPSVPRGSPRCLQDMQAGPPQKGSPPPTPHHAHTSTRGRDTPGLPSVQQRSRIHRPRGQIFPSKPGESWLSAPAPRRTTRYWPPAASGRWTADVVIRRPKRFRETRKWRARKQDLLRVHVFESHLARGHGPGASADRCRVPLPASLK